MKRKLINSAFTFIMVFFTLGFLITACEEDDSNDTVNSNEIKFQNATLSGANERPTVVNSPGTGTFIGTYNKETKMLTYSVTWTGFTATAMHFHNAPPTQNLPATAVSGPVVIGIAGTGSPATFTSPISGTTRALTTDEETNLLAGNWYINIHSSANPGGEIRAQIVQ